MMGGLLISICSISQIIARSKTKEEILSTIESNAKVEREERGEQGLEARSEVLTRYLLPY